MVLLLLLLGSLFLTSIVLSRFPGKQHDYDAVCEHSLQLLFVLMYCQRRTDTAVSCSACFECFNGFARSLSDCIASFMG